MGKNLSQVEEANSILHRAFEGGFFEPWVGKIWQRAERDALRAAARAMLGALAEGLKVRIDVKARDVYKDLESLPKGDWDKAKDTKLTSVYVVEDLS